MKRAEKLIIGGFLLLLLVVGGYHLWTTAGGGDTLAPGRTVTFVLPSTSGVTPGQAVVSGIGARGIALGQVAAIEPVSGGALITVRVEPGTTLYRGTRAILRPAPPPRSSTLEISAALATGEPLDLPAQIPASIELGAPEGMVEPTPTWPSAS
jgi:hypothetical protein